MATKLDNNPLLDFEGVPRFGDVTLEHFKPAITHLINTAKKVIEEILRSGELTWESVFLPYQEAMENLNEAWSVLSHFNGVMNTDELRAVYEELLSEMTAFNTQVSQDERLYELHEAFRSGAAYQDLDQDQRAALDHALQDFKLSGVALQAEDKKQFADDSQKLSALSNKFSQNVLDATFGWTKHVNDDSLLTGIPDSSLARFEQAAKAKDLDGGYLLSLDIPSYLPVMTYCENRELRRELYDAYICRASDQGPNAGEWDNSSIMKEILSLRQEQSRLLGFENYSEYSLASKMADTPEEVERFLLDLVEKSRSTAEQELSELAAFALEEDGLETLEMWDLPFYSERLKQKRFGFSKELLRAYFPANTVLEGLFKTCSKLFDIEVREGGNFSSYHEDARYFEIVSGGEVIAGVVMDLFAREGKRGGAWLGSCKSRYKSANQVMRPPIAFLVCNFTPPTSDSPSLLSPEEVTTLFHEFGHCLHYTLTEVETASVAGIRNVPWDAVELPSQMLENWCYQEEVLPMISAHFESQEPVPDEFVSKLKDAGKFQGGMMMLRQVEFALFDMILHRTYEAGEVEPLSVLSEVRERVAVKIPPSYTRFANSFGHIFAGGYAAGYYSYKWAEVLAADAFSRFEQEGLLDPSIGSEFKREFLSRGGSRDVMDMFVAFRGRKPDAAALLEQSGIKAA